MREIEVGNIIQIHPHSVLKDGVQEIDKCWIGCPMIVQEVKNWGVLAFVMTPQAGKRDEPPALFFLKIKHGDYINCGLAQYITESVYQNVEVSNKLKFAPIRKVQR